MMPQAPPAIESAFANASAKTGVPVSVLREMARKESSFNPNATNPSGAQGLFQFMPATAKQYGVNVSDPNSSALGAATYIKQLQSQFGGSLSNALAAYNWGPGNLQKYGMQNAPPETQHYVSTIMGNLGAGY